MQSVGFLGPVVVSGLSESPWGHQKLNESAGEPVRTYYSGDRPTERGRRQTMARKIMTRALNAW